MRVLIVSHCFAPEMGAPSSRLLPIARELAELGHEVSVATGMPNYPAGKVFPGYQGRRWMRESMDGFTVLRTLHYVTPRNRSQAAQIRNYLSFVPAALRSGLAAGKLDVVLASSPPLFTSIPAAWVARLRGAKFVLDVRDLWPDEFVTYGGMHEFSVPIRAMRRLERWAYRRADRICGTTEPILDTIVERGGDRAKTMYLPNGADVEVFRPFDGANPIANGLGFGNEFVVMYSGLFGIKHGLEVLLEAARMLRSYPEIQFLLVGNGARSFELAQEIERKDLTNVQIAGERPLHELPYILARADAAFAAVRPEPLPRKVISVKVFEYLACEKPVVGALSGESARVLEESRGGILVPPGNAYAVANAILELYHSPDRRREMGRRGRAYIVDNFSRRTWARLLEHELTNMVAGTSKADRELEPRRTV